jgi:pimeloyl-ACP methyl ester carboxylesterase
MRQARRVLALVVTLALAAAACSDAGSGGDDRAADAGTTESTAASIPEPERFTGTDFYAEPGELPDVPHGTLLRYQPYENAEVANATMWRIMYTSEDVGGEPIVVSGVVGIPTAAAPEGGRDVVTLAHGTTGIADECAPSKATGARATFAMRPFLDAGYLVAQSDYEGLGTAGRHPYLVGESEGRGVLDAAIAAEQLPDADGGDQLAIFGYSQGGHGALWAGQLAAEWAPDFDLVGTVAGAPATELPLILAAGARGAVAGFVYMIIAGFNDAYPDAPLSDVLTPQGEAELNAVDDGCAGDVLGHFAGLDSSQLLVPNGAETEPWASLAEENNPGNVVTDAPVLILHSAADDVVPVALSAILFDRMCQEGQVVERRVYQNGDGHGEAAPGAVADGAAWIQQRFAGEPAISTCPPPGG